MRSQPLLALNLLIVLFLSLCIHRSTAIQCYSGNQFSIIECPSLYCIKQTLGLDTVRYCDGTGVSSICATYRIIDTCQNVPSLGHICCCSDQLCNSSPSLPFSKVLTVLLMLTGAALWALNMARCRLLL